MLQVNEEFLSIQGEGFWTGRVVHFLRLQGCNWQCPWCDTEQARGREGGVYMTTEQVAEVLEKSPAQTVVVTGGEPMMQWEGIKDLMIRLPSKHFHLETNGTLPIPERCYFSWVTVSPKPPDYLIVPKAFEELKIVIDSEEAISKAAELAATHAFAHIYLQPVDNSEEWTLRILQELRGTWGLSVQLHKMLNLR